MHTAIIYFPTAPGLSEACTMNEEVFLSKRILPVRTLRVRRERGQEDLSCLMTVYRKSHSLSSISGEPLRFSFGEQTIAYTSPWQYIWHSPFYPRKPRHCLSLRYHTSSSTCHTLGDKRNEACRPKRQTDRDRQTDRQADRQRVDCSDAIHLPSFYTSPPSSCPLLHYASRQHIT